MYWKPQPQQMMTYTMSLDRQLKFPLIWKGEDGFLLKVMDLVSSMRGQVPHFGLLHFVTPWVVLF